MALPRLLSLVVVLTLWGCVPQPPSFDHHPAISLPQNLDTYLVDSEANVTDLKPGTEKKIRWIKHGKKSRYSIVYFHGYSASRQEISPVVETVADKIGANVYFARLTGHGVRGIDAVAAATPEDWIRDSWEAMEIGKRLGKEVILMGTSMGSVPAVQMALRNREVSHVVLIAPLLGWKKWQMNLALSPIGKFVLHAIYGETRSFKPVNDRQEYFWTTKYRVEALRNLFTFAKIQNSTDLSLLQKRTLVFYSPSDQIMPPDFVEKRFRQIGSGLKRLVLVKTANGHFVTGDIGAPESVDFTTREIFRFLSKGTPTP